MQHEVIALPVIIVSGIGLFVLYRAGPQMGPAFPSSHVCSGSTSASTRRTFFERDTAHNSILSSAMFAVLELRRSRRASRAGACDQGAKLRHRDRQQSA